jgi:hypothetical protein
MLYATNDGRNVIRLGSAEGGVGKSERPTYMSNVYNKRNA